MSEHGTVKWFDAEHGIGVIRADDGASLFTRGRRDRTLVAGERVTYDVEPGASGNPTAVYVRKLR